MAQCANGKYFRCNQTIAQRVSSTIGLFNELPTCDYDNLRRLWAQYPSRVVCVILRTKIWETVNNQQIGRFFLHQLLEWDSFSSFSLLTVVDEAAAFLHVTFL